MHELLKILWGGIEASFGIVHVGVIEVSFGNCVECRSGIREYSLEVLLLLLLLLLMLLLIVVCCCCFCSCIAVAVAVVVAIAVVDYWK